MSNGPRHVQPEPSVIEICAGTPDSSEPPVSFLISRECAMQSTLPSSFGVWRVEKMRMTALLPTGRKESVSSQMDGNSVFIHLSKKPDAMRE